jgi:hypothetical protein
MTELFQSLYYITNKIWAKLKLNEKVQPYFNNVS